MKDVGDDGENDAEDRKQEPRISQFILRGEETLNACRQRGGSGFHQCRHVPTGCHPFTFLAKSPYVEDVACISVDCGRSIGHLSRFGGNERGHLHGGFRCKSCHGRLWNRWWCHLWGWGNHSGSLGTHLWNRWSHWRRWRWSHRWRCRCYSFRHFLAALCAEPESGR